MKHQFDLLLTALMFYTRIRVSKRLPYSPELLNQSRQYFTFVGVIVGALVCAVFLIANIAFPTSIAVALSMIAGLFITGAFHEDGFADSCDALGGGWKSDEILSIMKDSRIGTYGTIGLIGILSLKFLVLIELAYGGALFWCLCVISAHATSRFHSSRLIKHYNYVQDTDQSKIKPITDAPLTPQAEQFGMIVTLTPCLILASLSFLMPVLGFALAYIASNSFMHYCEQQIGGYTGDILGAIQQIAEVVFLLSCLAVFKF